MAINLETESRLLELVPQDKTAPQIHQIMVNEWHTISLRTVNYRLSEYNELAHQTLAELQAEAVEAMADKKLDLAAKIRLLEQLIDKAQVVDCVPRNPGQAVGYLNAILKYRQAERAGRDLYTTKQVEQMFKDFETNLLDKLTEVIENELKKHEITDETAKAITSSIIAPIRGWFSGNSL